MPSRLHHRGPDLSSGYGLAFSSPTAHCPSRPTGRARVGLRGGDRERPFGRGEPPVVLRFGERPVRGHPGHDSRRRERQRRCRGPAQSLGSASAGQPGTSRSTSCARRATGRLDRPHTWHQLGFAHALHPHPADLRAGGRTSSRSSCWTTPRRSACATRHGGPSGTILREFTLSSARQQDRAPSRPSCRPPSSRTRSPGRSPAGAQADPGHARPPRRPARGQAPEGHDRGRHGEDLQARGGQDQDHQPNGYALKGTFSLSQNATRRQAEARQGQGLAGRGRHQGVQVQAVEEGAAPAAQEAQAARGRHGEAQGADRQDRTIRKKLTLKAPAKPRRKKRKRRSGGGQGRATSGSPATAPPAPTTTSSSGSTGQRST